MQLNNINENALCSQDLTLLKTMNEHTRSYAMNFSVKKLFGKKDNQSENAVLTKQQNAQPKTDTQEAPKKKHGEPGVCCGSCS
ncbi:hypothetical protein VSU01S_13950 [Vibrio superstes NBRC 103154]|uniref:CCGSCS motif protein n=2 Tax=Vibrio superstes TaxID=198815 RepID=A0A511QPA5_9VIBR|nr:hypothetical protein VSU01S_13950 [Vibrio superstes NBRC 103154]